MKKVKIYNSKTMIMLLTITIFVGLPGCSGDSNKHSNLEKSMIQEEEEVGRNDTEQIEKETEKDSPQFFYSAHGFYCHRAWVQKKQDGPWSCIDPSGKEIFSLREDQIPSSDFQNGIAVVDNELIVDVNGEVVSSVEDGIYTKILEGYYKDGYVFVEVYKNSIEETYTKTGIIDNKGEWWLEPINISSIDNLGHGVYVFWTEEGSIFYDLYNNTYIDKESYLELLLQRSYSDNDLIFIWKTNSGDNHFKGDADKSFNIKSDLGFETDVTGFYNRDKELIIDMSQYADAVAESDFVDGYCVMTLFNDQGQWFVTVIDEKGNIMFDPISFNDNLWSYEGFSEGLLCYSMAGNRYDYTFLNVYGETVLEKITPSDGCEFDEEGFLRVFGMKEKDPNKISFIDINGEIVF